MGDKMTLVQLLCSLRQRLVDAIKEDDRQTISELKTTFTMLKEAVYEDENKGKELMVVLVDLEDAAQDGVMRVAWKSDIPSPQAIEKAVMES
jgi:aspartate/glutamate racemase